MGDSVARDTVLLISQVFVPDPASVGQHMADLARDLVRKGSRVIVLTARRGYEQPSRLYPRHERIDGVEVIRVPLSSFGKQRFLARLAAAFLFPIMAIIRGSSIRNVTKVLVSTSPPTAPLAGLFLSSLYSASLVFWVMDLNPDQSVAIGAIKDSALSVKLLRWLNRKILSQADEVVVLDRFMEQRIRKHYGISREYRMVPPWPHQRDLNFAESDRLENAFRECHGLEDDFVFMYSGNHSPVHPLDTLLSAISAVQDLENTRFVFVGGGREKDKVEQLTHAVESGLVLSLPYQPLSELGVCLTAADVHLVVMGSTMTGVVHPCKAYGAISVGRPLLFIGPERSHISDLIRNYGIGWEVRHGDVKALARTLRRIRSLDRIHLETLGERARGLAERQFSQRVLCSEMSDIVLTSANKKDGPDARIRNRLYRTK